MESNHHQDNENSGDCSRGDAADLAEAGLFAQLASDHSPDVQLVVDPMGDIRYVGGTVEQLVGLTPEETLKESIWEFVHPEDLDSALGAFNEAARVTGYHLPTAFRVRGPNDTWVDAEIKGTTFEGPGGTWLIISIRQIADRGEVIARRRSIETLIREASTACSAVSWPQVDKVVTYFLEQLVGIVNASSFSMGWETAGRMELGAIWPERHAAAHTDGFEQLWPREVLSSSMLHVSLHMEDVPRSLLRDLMIVDGVRAVVEFPLSDEAPWGVGRFTFKGSAAHWDDANLDLVKVLVTTLMSTIWRCRAERSLQEQATTDPLTGLMNRAELYRALDTCLADRRTSGKVAVFYGDLDNFKMVNDLRGHNAGDELLCAVAEALRSSVRAVDVIARLGGDEFVIVCPDVDDLSQLDMIRDRIFESFCQINTFDVPVSISLGMALAEDGESSGELLSRADHLMYRTKRAAANRRLIQPTIA